MNKIELIQKDINRLEKALKLVMQTENYILIKKSSLIKELQENIDNLSNSQERTKEILNNLSNNQ